MCPFTFDKYERIFTSAENPFIDPTEWLPFLDRLEAQLDALIQRTLSGSHTLAEAKLREEKAQSQADLLDAGSQLNKVSIKYDNLSEVTSIVTGIVLHEPSEDYQTDATKGYIAYADPEDAVNGQTFAAAVFPNKINEAKAVKFSDKEKKERGANGHVLAYNTYAPGSVYTYYCGAGWSKWGFENSTEWFNHVQQFAQKLKEPLQVTIK